MPATNEAFLETLVKLAAAGTSGICIFAIFAAGFILSRANKDTPPQKYEALKSFMKMAIFVAIISAGTTTAAGYWDYKTKIALKAENQELTEKTEEQQQTITLVETKAATLENELNDKDQAIASIRDAFKNISPNRPISPAQWSKINQGVIYLNPHHPIEGPLPAIPANKPHMAEPAHE